MCKQLHTTGASIPTVTTVVTEGVIHGQTAFKTLMTGEQRFYNC